MGKRISSIIKWSSESRIAIITSRGKLKELKPPKIKRSRKSVMQRSITAANKEARLLSSSSARVSTEQANASAPVTNENNLNFEYDDNYDDDYAADQYEGDNINNHPIIENTFHPFHPTDTSPRLISLSTRAEREDIEWANLFPQLWKAYLRGLGLHTTDTTKLDLVQTRRCNCEVMDSNKITCVFKCGIKHDIHVSSCKTCEGFSLPIILMESHMYIRQQFVQHQSVTSIAKVVAKEFPRTIVQKHLTKTLPIYAKMKMVIEDHLEITYKLNKSDICPACMYQNLNDASSPLCVGLDGNFSSRRLANASDDSGDTILDPNYQSIKNYWIAEQIPVEPVRASNTQRSSCSSFKALSEQRKGNARGLDETGEKHQQYKERKSF
ncbi:hypothetical protein BDC45DRAFT_540519 [Circinella umbellata]|nr:hypothetical protein BDC45DRAFT_540519 [Circinella umbellata]